MKPIQPFIAILCVLLMVAPAGFGQDTTSQQPVGGWSDKFGGFFKRYQGSIVSPVNVSNSSRLEQLVRAGKLYLSLNDAISAALENNIDIEIQRYGPRLAETDMLRARAGAVLRGVSTSVTTGASSAGGSGVFGATGSTLGTSTSSLGPTVASLDPTATGTLQWGHLSSPQTSSFTTGTNTLVQRQKIYNFGVTEGFITGTSATLSLANTVSESNSIRNQFNPVTSSAGELYVSQHLLQGFGRAVNNRYIRIAKNNLSVADLTLRQQVENVVANVIGLYWDLVAFNEDVAVKKQALALAQKLYNDNKKQVEIGTLAPIEIVRAEAEVASREQDLTTSETSVLQQETIIKNAISRNGVASPTIAEVSIVPTDSIRMPDVEPVQPIQDLVSKALDARPDLAESRLQIQNSAIVLKAVKTGMLPTLDAFVDMKNHGQAGTGIPSTTVDSSGNYVTTYPNSYFIGGYGTVLSQVLGRNFPDYVAGFQLNIPLRNRAAIADYTTAQLNLRQNELMMQRQINGIRVDVQNALIALQQARARYAAAEKNRVLQEQTLDAEQKKYALGASTVYMVIQAQRDLATAESTRVAALAAYARARTQLDVSTGQTLASNHVEIEDAKRGTVSRPPSPIPAVEPGTPRSQSRTTVGTPLADRK